MICPVCDRDMTVVEYKGIELDYCTGCQGIWFDAGELGLLLKSRGRVPEVVCGEPVGCSRA
jgi:Zn-finger nucleic acid-binding protein